MSMHRDVKMATDIDEDESFLEAEIQRELDALNAGDLEDDSDDKENIIQDSSSDQDESKEKVRMSEMDEYVLKMQSQTARLEQELQECDELMQHTDLIVSTPRPDQDDLVVLAEARGMDAETLKRKVLEELDREDMEDERLMLESVNDDWDQAQQPQDALATITNGTKPAPYVSDNGDAQPISNTQTTFLTGVGEQNMSEEEEYRQLKKNYLGPDREEVEEEKVAEGELDEEANEEDENEENNPPGKLTLKLGEGTLMSMVDSEALERRVMREVLDWEVKWMKTNEEKEQELAALIQEDREKQEEAQRQREERQRIVEEQQKVLHLQQQAQEEKLRKEAEALQGQIEQSIEEYEIEIEQLTNSVRMDSEALLQEKVEGQKQDGEKRERAALKIQAAYRGYRVYKEDGRQLKAHLEEWRQQKLEARIKALDESRKKKMDDKRKKEDAEKRRIEAEENRKEEEKNLKEEEKMRKEEEQKRKEEEKRLKAEEAKRKKEEEEQRKLEEKRLKEEEKRKKKEAEQKRKEAEQKRKEEEAKKKEEEKKRKEEEKRQQEENLRLEKLRQEEEAKRLEEEREAEAKRKVGEEERKAKEEEERQRQEAEAAVKKAEEEKLKQLGIGTPRSPVPPDGRPKTPRKKINDLRRSAMSPLANGVKSPPSSAGSQRSGSSPGSEPVQANSSGPLPEPPPEPVSTPPHSSRLRTPRTARSDSSLSLPELIEKRRLEWMEKCRPWSKTERELKIKNKPANTRKPLRRPISAKNMPELTPDQILRAAGEASLQQVTTVELHDLPGCTLKTLAGCPRLRTLRVNHCKAVTTEGLGECKHLLYLDIQHNVLETVSLRDLDKLVYLDVSHNNLTAMQGLEGCTALRYLKASHNRMTRISGLDGLRSLHTLDLSHNQLITTKGLGAAPTLQEVDLSHNHLPALDDLDLLGLLQVLKAAGNNIIQLPILTNHVLLRHLVLDDNSLCSVRSLSQSWLPLLRCLSMAQNSLTTLDELSTCVILQDLNISNNQILDVDSLLPGLKSCRHLSHLKTDGNPAHEETDFRARVLEVLPWLEKLDGQSPASPGDPPAVTDFERMCGEQLTVWDKLTQQYQQVLRGTPELPDLVPVHVRYFTTSHNIAVEQRYAHEYGESTSSGTDGGNMTFDLSAGSSAGHVSKPRSDTSQMKNKFEIALQNVNGSNSEMVNGSQQNVGNTTRDSVRSSQMDKSKIRSSLVSKGLRQPASTGNSVQAAAATRIQALWRGYQVRRDIDFHSRLWMAATSIQALWRGYFTRKVLQEMGYFVGAARDEPLHRAATVIQAGWRGHRVRKRIRYALSYARMSFDEDDLDEDLDFTEVDLSAFDFNEADLEKGWTPPETPQLPANNRRRSQKPNASHAVIGKPSASSQQQAADAKAAFDAAFNTPQQPFPLVKRPPHPPQHPRQAWRNVDSPLSEAAPGGGRPPLPPLSRLSDHTATDSQATARTYRSKKEEKITEEWGFKDSKTAELMMQRAKKLKHNAARKKKISQLDPKQRLALFRKLEETTNVRTVQPPVKKILPRKEYFQEDPDNPFRVVRHHSMPEILPSAREEEVVQKAVEKQREQVNHHMRTYEWLHTQVGGYPAPASSRINQGLSEAGQYNSEGNLPQMDAHVMSGARPNLTVYDKKRRNASPMLLELQSVESVSTAGDLQRRMSGGSDPASRLPPIKVSSAPSAHIHERMSFRNPKPKPSMESVGWGGGKKRSSRR